MALCPRCNSKLPERARFCLLCGASVGEGSSPDRFERQGAPPRFWRSDPPREDSDPPELEEKPRRASAARGGAECRFCHSPLDLDGDFCESCGAPIAEAVPAGMGPGAEAIPTFPLDSRTSVLPMPPKATTANPPSEQGSATMLLAEPLTARQETQTNGSAEPEPKRVVSEADLPARNQASVPMTSLSAEKGDSTLILTTPLNPLIGARPETPATEPPKPEPVPDWATGLGSASQPPGSATLFYGPPPSVSPPSPVLGHSAQTKPPVSETAALNPPSQCPSEPPGSATLIYGLPPRAAPSSLRERSVQTETPVSETAILNSSAPSPAEEDFTLPLRGSPLGTPPRVPANGTAARVNPVNPPGPGAPLTPNVSSSASREAPTVPLSGLPWLGPRAPASPFPEPKPQLHDSVRAVASPPVAPTAPRLQPPRQPELPVKSSPDARPARYPADPTFKQSPSPVATQRAEAPAAQPRKPFPSIAVAVGAGLLAVVVGIVWYVSRPSAPPQRVSVPAPVATPSPAEPSAELTPPEQVIPALPEPQATQPASPQAVTTPGVAKPRPVRPKKALPPPPPAKPEPSPQEVEIARLQGLARDAYAQGNYAQPVETSAITYAKRVLSLDAGNNYAKTLIEDSVSGGKYKVHEAIQRKDFATAHHIANALAQLLPERTDIAGLQKDISASEKASEAPKPQAPAVIVSFKAYHMHGDKAPADHGPYCLGMLAVSGSHIRFTGDSAPDGEKVHSLDIACSEVKEIKKNMRVASHQGGFHVRTYSENINFAPTDASPSHASALAAACSE